MSNGLVGAGLAPALGTRKGCPYDRNETHPFDLLSKHLSKYRQHCLLSLFANPPKPFDQPYLVHRPQLIQNDLSLLRLKSAR